MIINPKDISIYFSGHNISTFAAVAVKSFLFQYPELKYNIFYLDDFSTDDTKSVLSALGVNVISWDKELKSQFDYQYENGWYTSGIHSLINRCDFIFKSILKQANTRYVLIQDGDTVTLGRGFLEEYIKSGNVISNLLDASAADIRLVNAFKSNPLYKDYEPFIHDSNYAEGFIEFHRFHPYHLFIDMEALGDFSVLINNLYDRNYIELNGGAVIDVGSDLYKFAVDNNFKFQKYNYNNLIYHWSWISSIMRDVRRDCSSSGIDRQKVITNAIKDNKDLLSVIRHCGYNPSDLLRHLVINMRNSEYN